MVNANKVDTNQSQRQCRRMRTRHTFYQTIHWWCTGTVFKTTAVAAIFNYLKQIYQQLLSTYSDTIGRNVGCIKAEFVLLSC